MFGQGFVNKFNTTIQMTANLFTWGMFNKKKLIPYYAFLQVFSFQDSGFLSVLITANTSTILLVSLM